MTSSAVEGAAIPSRRRLTPSASLLLLAAAFAWVGVVMIADDMGSMPGTMGLALGAFVAVWTLMMAAMMLPSVAPFASLYTRAFRTHRVERVTAFALGYLVVAAAAAVPAYGLAWVVDRTVADDATLATALAAVIFAVCGLYQLSPFKDRCLAHCRSPFASLMQYSSYRGATRDVRVGVHHGANCIGCCWALMAALLAFGIMNVAAMLGLAVIVVMEKTWGWGARFGRVVGVVALALAVVVIFVPGVAPGLVPLSHGHAMGGGGM
jgi:predicted metal-binding membrane protein